MRTDCEIQIFKKFEYWTKRIYVKLQNANQIKQIEWNCVHLTQIHSNQPKIWMRERDTRIDLERKENPCVKRRGRVYRLESTEIYLCCRLCDEDKAKWSEVEHIHNHRCYAHAHSQQRMMSIWSQHRHMPTAHAAHVNLIEVAEWSLTLFLPHFCSFLHSIIILSFFLSSFLSHSFHSSHIRCGWICICECICERRMWIKIPMQMNVVRF